MQLDFSVQFFEKSSNIKCNEYPYSGSRVNSLPTDGRSDRHDEEKETCTKALIIYHIPKRNTTKVKGKKGKAAPLQAWSGPEGSGKLRFPDFMTMAQDGDKVVSFTHRSPLPPGNTPGTHFC